MQHYGCYHSKTYGQETDYLCAESNIKMFTCGGGKKNEHEKQMQFEHFLTFFLKYIYGLQRLLKASTCFFDLTTVAGSSTTAFDK